MFRKILIPLDGSELAEQAIPAAMALARQSQGEILLLRVPVFETAVMPAFGGYGVMYPEQSLEHSRAEAREYLKATQQHNVAPDISCRALIVDGDVASAIVDVAKEENVDVIVMSTHGYSGVTRWVMGSVTERVLGDASCPVYVVRAPELPRHVMITLDGSEFAERALEPGLETAAMFGAKVTVMSAIRDVSVSVLKEMETLERGMAQRLHDDMVKDVEEYLGKIAKRYHRDDLTLKTATTFEPAATSILDYVETHDVDLLVMATHGRSGLLRWVYGSVTEKVLRGAKRSMLIVRAK
ncbi:MAG: universal stress protein [Chloroflexi bacterium]|nr:universal stress protein [Chloroflexota bacterium]